ncbi:uncharacterized protein LOC127720427 isoform X2 [Mytilus californianus]|uniref:uncharacterized protein LOC127720427 isoform X2 n=1 Tax=Mytilus californianus TaxID=6549 RepID=UPI002247F872|nr:uncharacterized protein LOC127720427 isoform X2 [Mytilus californianus]
MIFLPFKSILKCIHLHYDSKCSAPYVFTDMRGGTKKNYWMVNLVLTTLVVAATIPSILTCGAGQKERKDTYGASICCFTAHCNTSQRFRFCQKDQGYDICQDCPADQYTNDFIDTSQWKEETDVCVLKPDCSAPEKILVGNKCECDRSKGYYGTDPDNCSIRLNDCKKAGYQLDLNGNCIECGPNQFKPGRDQYGICQDKRECKDGEIEENPGSITSDRICQTNEEPTTVVPEIITTTETATTTVSKQSDKTWIIGIVVAVAILVCVGILYCNRNTLREKFKEFFNARCKECKRGGRHDPEENEHMLNSIENDRLQNDRLQNNFGRQSANGSAGNGHMIGSEGHTIPNSTFQREQDISMDNQVSNGSTVVKRNRTQSDTNINEYDEQRNSSRVDSVNELVSDLTMSTFIDGSGTASICENQIETKDRSKMPHSDNKPFNSLNADSLLQDDSSFGEQALNSESIFAHSSPQTQSSVPCDRDPDTIPKTMSDNFSVESVKEPGEESLSKNNSNGNIPAPGLFQSLQTVPNRQTDLNEINHQSDVPDIPATNPTAAKEILKPQIRVKPMAKVIPIRSTSQEQQANPQASVSGAEGFTASPTTANGIDIQIAVNNDSHKVVANTPYGEYPDMRENNREDDTNSTLGTPPSMVRQQPSLTTNQESPQTEEINLVDNIGQQPNFHQTASGNMLAAPVSDNSGESASNQSSLQQETDNVPQAPDSFH